MADGRAGRWRRAFVAGLAMLLLGGGIATAVAVARPGGLGELVGVVPSSSPSATPTASAASGVPASASPAAPATSGASPSSAPSAVPSGAPTAAPSTEPSAPPPVDAATAARLQRALEAVRKSLILPGVSATVIFPNGSAWTGVAGYAVPSKKIPVRPETPFALASVTKTFTAALILRFQDQGLLSIDDPLSRYLPDFPNARRITLRMLLQHTSGLPDFFMNPKIDVALLKNKRLAWTPAMTLAYVLKPVVAPGKVWYYSNTNYVLLGLVAEKVGGASWADLVHRQLLDPLGLHGITVQGVDPPIAPPAHANVMYVGAGGQVLPRDQTDGTAVVPFTSVATAAWSAGVLAADSGDLARWGRALYGGTVLSPVSRIEMLTFDPDIARAYATAYGLGASRVTFDGHVAFGHTGALAGTRSAIRWFPREKLTIAALFNRDVFRGDDVIRALVHALYPAGAKASPGPGPGPTAKP